MGGLLGFDLNHLLCLTVIFTPLGVVFLQGGLVGFNLTRFGRALFLACLCLYLTHFVDTESAIKTHLFLLIGECVGFVTEVHR